MKLLLNGSGDPVKIMHCQGKSTIMQQFFGEFAKDYINAQFTFDYSDITIITVFTDKSRSPLVYQLENNGIPYVNAYREEYGIFYMPNKIQYIVNTLKEVTTKYCLILDGYDVLLLNPEKIIDSFLEYNTRMLFNASMNNFPVAHIDKIPERDYIGQFKHFNAGCAIGYTADFLDFYQDALLLQKSDSFSNPYNSEQYVLRHIFAKNSETCIKKNPYITIDWKCNVFAAMSGVACSFNDDHTICKIIASEI